MCNEINNRSESFGSGVDLRIPIILSVTGHRNISNPSDDALIKHLTSYFENLKNGCNNTPIYLLSALAEGADRIAAQAAVKAKISLFAVLPMQIARYEDTFLEEDSKFNELLDSAVNGKNPYIIPDAKISKEEMEKIEKLGEIEQREEYKRLQFLALGKFLVSNSHMVIALWNGKDSKEEGGTADTVRMAHFGLDWRDLEKYKGSEDEITERATNIFFLNMVPACPVYWIRVNEAVEKQDANLDADYILQNSCPGSLFREPLDVKELLKKEKDTHQNSETTIRSRLSSFFGSFGQVSEKLTFVPEPCRKTLLNIDRINEDIVKKPEEKNSESIQEYANKILENRNHLDLLPKNSDKQESKKGSTEEQREDPIEKCKKEEAIELASKLIGSHTSDSYCGKFAVADKLALEYQDDSFRNSKIYLVMVTLANLLLSIYLVLSDDILVLISYAVVFLTSLGMYYYYVKYTKRKVHTRFIGYRQLAEFMRVKYYWHILGVNETLTHTLYEYLRNPTLPIRDAMKGWSLELDQKNTPKLSETEKIKLVRTAWVMNQYTYHVGKKKKNEEEMSRHSRFYLMFTVAAVVSSGIVIFAGSHLGNITLFGFGAVVILNFILAFSNVMATREVTIQAQHIHGGSAKEIDLKIQMHETAKIKLDRIIYREKSDLSFVHEEVCRQIYCELGIQCMEECSEWADTHISKDISKPPLPKKS
jgi:hypothetical protein